MLLRDMISIDRGQCGGYRVQVGPAESNRRYRVIEHNLVSAVEDACPRRYMYDMLDNSYWCGPSVACRTTYLYPAMLNYHMGGPT